MADYTDSKENTRSVYPANAVDGQDWARMEPLITPDQLRRRFLFGIDLVSATISPVTKKRDIKTNEDLKDHILRAVSEAELDSQIDIFPVQRSEKYDFDRNLLENYGHMRVNHKPVLSIEKLSIRPGNGEDIYIVPNEWIDNGYFLKGIVHILPLMPFSSGNQALSGGRGGGAVFLNIITSRGWVPSFWNVEYTTGFKDGAIPKVINELIGCYAAIEVLGELAATHTASSYSQGLDGMSQSVSTPGPELYNTRIKLLEDKKTKLLKKVKALYGTKFILSHL